MTNRNKSGKRGEGAVRFLDLSLEDKKQQNGTRLRPHGGYRGKFQLDLTDKTFYNASGEEKSQRCP